MNRIKGLTWETSNEHAVVRLADGRKAIVSGGPGGIEFEYGQIRTLFGHTHPPPVGPSSADFIFLSKYRFYGGKLAKVDNMYFMQDFEN